MSDFTDDLGVDSGVTVVGVAKGFSFGAKKGISVTLDVCLTAFSFSTDAFFAQALACRTGAPDAVRTMVSAAVVKFLVFCFRDSF